MNDYKRGLALNVDQYQLTMAAAYFESALDTRPTFELFVRELPRKRSYLVVAGLAQALDYLSRLKFYPAEIEYLKGLPPFETVKDDFFDYLSSFEFRGDVWAMAEGSIAFAQEPLLRVTANIIEAQIVETYLLATLNFQTTVATKASRVVAAAQGRPVVDFGTRRAHGPEAGVLAARASFIGGCVATSNLEAGLRYGIPTMGTAAHSFIMAYGSEKEAFAHYMKAFPESASLLIDTYDTLAGARLAGTFGAALRSVRLDSGNVGKLSKKVRGILDKSGCKEAKIVASGDLNEERIAKLLRDGAPVDVFGVGTEMVVSKDVPALGGVYKMVETGREGAQSYAVKFSPDKETYPGAKQVLRNLGPDGCYQSDVIALASEPKVGNQVPLLEPVMRQGKTLAQAPSLEAIRAKAQDNLGRLSERHKRLKDAEPYPVRISDALEGLRLKAVRQLKG